MIPVLVLDLLDRVLRRYEPVACRVFGHAEPFFSTVTGDTYRCNRCGRKVPLPDEPADTAS